jgi:hypothetical protein
MPMTIYLFRKTEEATWSPKDSPHAFNNLNIHALNFDKFNKIQNHPVSF